MEDNAEARVHNLKAELAALEADLEVVTEVDLRDSRSGGSSLRAAT
jgi:hypothetical protein